MWEAPRIQGSLVVENRWSWGGVVRIVTFRDCGLDARAGKTRKCRGGGSTSYCCSSESRSLCDHQNDVPIKEFCICRKGGIAQEMIQIMSKNPLDPSIRNSGLRPQSQHFIQQWQPWLLGWHSHLGTHIQDLFYHPGTGTLTILVIKDSPVQNGDSTGA